MKADRPFLTRSDPASNEERHIMVGMSFDGKPFELARTPHYSVNTACMQKVELRWCTRLDVSTPAPGMYPRFQCVEPGPVSLQCDETKSRKASWQPPEALPPKSACNSRWRSPSEPVCKLKALARPLAKGAPVSPLLVCRSGVEKMSYACRVEATPIPTSQNRGPPAR